MIITSPLFYYDIECRLQCIYDIPDKIPSTLNYCENPKSTIHTRANDALMYLQETLLLLDSLEKDIKGFWDYILFLGDLAYKEVTSVRIKLLEKNAQTESFWVGTAIDLIFAAIPGGGFVKGSIKLSKKLLKATSLGNKVLEKHYILSALVNNVVSNNEILNESTGKLVKEMYKKLDSAASSKVKSLINGIKRSKDDFKLFSFFDFMLDKKPVLQPDVQVYEMIYNYVEVMKSTLEYSFKTIKENLVTGQFESLDELVILKSYLAGVKENELKIESIKSNEENKWKMVLYFELLIWARLVDWSQEKKIVYRERALPPKDEYTPVMPGRIIRTETVPVGIAEKIWNYLEPRFIKCTIKTVLKKEVYDAYENVSKEAGRRNFQLYMREIVEKNNLSMNNINNIISDI